MEGSKNFKSSLSGDTRVQEADLYLGECPIAEAGTPRLPQMCQARAQRFKILYLRQKRMVHLRLNLVQEHFVEIDRICGVNVFKYRVR